MLASIDAMPPKTPSMSSSASAHWSEGPVAAAPGGWAAGGQMNDRPRVSVAASSTSPTTNLWGKDTSRQTPRHGLQARPGGHCEGPEAGRHSPNLSLRHAAG